MNIAIVGSNRGIGLELVKKFSSDGSNVYAFCRRCSQALFAASPFQIIENFDVVDKDTMKEVLNENIKVKFDMVIHVSGILKEDCEESFEADSIEQFRVNAIGPINSYEAFSSFLTENAKFGVLTSQLGSITNNLSGGRFGYRMAKAAANMACKNLSINAQSRGVTVVMLHPGYVETDMTGNSADISAETSAEGLKKILDNISLSQTGTFWHVNGDQLPW